jgi:hypothetical protein
MDDSSDDDPPDTPSTQYVWRSAPPDGGWGWVIVLGAFVINIITDGCSYSDDVRFVLDQLNTLRLKLYFIVLAH